MKVVEHVYLNFILIRENIIIIISGIICRWVRSFPSSCFLTTSLVKHFLCTPTLQPGHQLRDLDLQPLLVLHTKQSRSLPPGTVKRPCPLGVSAKLSSLKGETVGWWIGGVPLTSHRLSTISTMKSLAESMLALSVFSLYNSYAFRMLMSTKLWNIFNQYLCEGRSAAIWYTLRSSTSTPPIPLM